MRSSNYRALNGKNLVFCRAQRLFFISRRTDEILGAQLKLLGAQLKMLVAPKRKIRSFRHFISDR